jgi:cysteine desulfurase
MVQSSGHRVYLDHSATTPVAREVADAMAPFHDDVFGNASSQHSFGRDAAAALDDAHFVIGCALGARASEIVFTGCGTESDNLALRGSALAARKQRGFKRGHLISALTEHHAVEATIQQLGELHDFDITFVPVDSEGRVAPDVVKAALRPDTVLVSLMLANNEVGSIQDIASIGMLCRAHEVLLHTDAVQAPAYMNIDVNALNVDLLALSAHKFYGPKGVGVLYVRDGTPYLPTLTGGGHERGRRAGTVNVAGAVGAAAALKYVARERAAQSARLRVLRDRLIAGVLSAVPESRLTGHATERLPGHSSFVFNGVDGESLLMALDVEGYAVSTGSACASGDPEPSPVLTAMGIPREWALGGLRITLGYHSSDADVDGLLATLPRCVERVRRAAAELSY